jgi:hypothetical protein
MRNESVRTLDTRRSALLKRLAEIGPLVQGSYCTVKVKCGKPGCRCSRGEPHQACVLTRKVRGRTVTTHVPRDLRSEVEAWAQQYRQVMKLVKDISALSERIIRIHVQTSRAVTRNRNRLSPTRSKPCGACCDSTSPGSSSG